MKRLVSTVVLALAANTLPLIASAQTPPPPTGVPAQDKPGPRQFRPRQPPAVKPSGFDTRGWTLLGEQTADGRRDRDEIRVSGNPRYTDLVFVVEDGDVEVFDVTVFFADNTSFTPNVRHVFRDGQRTRAIDLPRDARGITRIVFKYGNTASGARPRIQAWGKTVASAPAPAPAPAQPPGPVASGFDPRGWTKIDDKNLRGRGGRDSLQVERRAEGFTKLALVVEDGEAALTAVTVFYGNGQRYSPMLTQVVGNAARVRVVDLPAEVRQIKRVEFAYTGVAVGRPHVELWGKADAAAPAQPSGFNPSGWTFLGEKRVDGWQDKDSIKVPRQFGRFNKLVVVVEDSDVELLDLTVNYGRGERFTPAVNQVYRNGQRTKVVDLPGPATGIKRIDLRYRNLPGDGRPARIQIWAREDAPSTPPPRPTPEWDSRGWVPLGAFHVDPSQAQYTMTGFAGRRYSKVNVVATHALVDLESITMTLTNGRKGLQRVGGELRESQRVVTVDVPTADPIDSLTFRWGRNRGGGEARFEVYGLPATDAPSPSIRGVVGLDLKGWTSLGSIRANPANGQDSLTGIGRGWLQKIGLLVDRGDLDVDSLTVTFADGTRFSPSFRHTFKNGNRGILILLPEEKVVSSIELRYADRRGAPALVEVFGESK